MKSARTPAQTAGERPEAGGASTLPDAESGDFNLKAIIELVSRARDENLPEEDRETAVRSLADIDHPEAVKEMIDLLAGDGWQALPRAVRQAASGALIRPKCVSAAASVFPRSMAVANGECEGDFASLCNTLRFIKDARVDAAADRFVELYIDLATKNVEDPICSAILWLLVRFGEGAKAILPLLLRQLEHPNIEIRREATAALGELGHFAAPAVPCLIANLAINELRHSSMRTLGKIGPAAAAAVPAIEQLVVQTKDCGSGYVLAGALKGI